MSSFYDFFDAYFWFIPISFVVSALLSGYVANEKGRRVGNWIFISFIVSPIVALIALSALPDNVEKKSSCKEE